MNQTDFVPSSDLSDTIIFKIAEAPQSPYRILKKKADDIDVDYFDDIRRDTETLPSELNLELKDKVLNDFSQLIDKLLKESGLVDELLNDVREKAKVVRERMGDVAYSKFLESLATDLHGYTPHGQPLAMYPKYTDSDLIEKYESAKRQTLKERILNNNMADVIDFHYALMDRTWWECRSLLEYRIGDFIKTLADRISRLKNQ